METTPSPASPAGFITSDWSCCTAAFLLFTKASGVEWLPSTRGRSVFERYCTTLTVILVNVALSLVSNLTPVWHAVLIRNGKVFSQLGPIGVCKLSHHIEGGMSCPETLYETVIHVSSWGQGWGSLDFCCVDLVLLWTKNFPVLQHIQKNSASHKSLDCEGRECITSDEYVPIRRIYLDLGAGLHQFPRVQQARVHVTDKQQPSSPTRWMHGVHCGGRWPFTAKVLFPQPCVLFNLAEGHNSVMPLVKSTWMLRKKKPCAWCAHRPCKGTMEIPSIYCHGVILVT